MAKKKRNYDLEFKKEAVRLASEPDRKIKDVAEALGVHPFSLSRWKRQLRQGRWDEEGVVQGPDVKDTRIKYLEKKLAQVEEEREILKKALAIFSRNKEKSGSSSKSTGETTP